MLNLCPDSWENSSKKRTEKSYYTENSESEGEEQAFFTRDFKVPYKRVGKEDENVKNVMLYTGGNKKEIDFLGSETVGRIILDCGCSEKICGQFVRGSDR